jgi:hypothetical protein
MDPEWPATRLYLQSIRQEYDAIHEERATEPDWRRRDQLWEWELVCLKEFARVLQERCGQTIQRE